MAGDTQITIVGSLGAAPELRFTSSGVPVANFDVASTPRTFDKQRNEWQDGEALWLHCTVWRGYAENVAESLDKGMRVIVHGYLKARSHTDRDGNKRTVHELDVQEVGPALRYASARVTRNPAEGSQQGGYQQPQQGWSQPAVQPGGDGSLPAGGQYRQPAAQPAQEPLADPWATQSGQETPPF